MNNSYKNYLLPEGLKVLLPDEAEKEELISRRILDQFYKNGYLLVKTPMLEDDGADENKIIRTNDDDSFFLVEPETKKVLIFRSDITPQIAKLASSKLKKLSRPLRLTYSGEVLRNTKNIYQSDKQFKQIGAEIIGAPIKESLSEILNITFRILKNLKINNFTIDFSLPIISRYLEKNVLSKSSEGSVIKHALENKDSSLIKNKKFNYIKDLIELSGTVEEAKKYLKKSKIPKKVENMLLDFFNILDKVRKERKDISMTVDITEGNSFLRYKNFGFKIYNKDNANTIAIGGDYVIKNDEKGLGVTIMVNKLLMSIERKKDKKVYVPYDIPNESLKKFKKSKNIFIRELFPRKNSKIEAKRFNCQYILQKNGKLIKS